MVAGLHARPHKAHQRLVCDLLGEQLPAGGYAYPVAVVTLPRQTGKTTIALDVAIGRALVHRDYRAAYAAQTGHVTTQRFLERFTELEGGPLARALRLRRSAGTERVTVPVTGSYVFAYPPKDGALRSAALDLVVVDEAQEHDAQLGDALDQTIMPTFTTRPRRQYLIIGTAGTHRSGFLRRYLDLARAGTPGVALVEYGATDSDDPLAESTWARRHPGLASGLTDTAAMRQALATLGEAGFVREYLNVWVVSDQVVLDPLAWAACQTPDPLPAGPPAFGVAVTPDRRSAVVCAAVGAHVELVEVCPGWEASARVRALYGRWRPGLVVLDRVGPAGSLADELDRAAVPLAPFTARDLVNACADLADQVAGRRVLVRPHPALDAAVRDCSVRPLGDGGWVWSRRRSAGQIAALEAATLALWGAARPAGRAAVRTLS